MQPVRTADQIPGFRSRVRPGDIVNPNFMAVRAPDAALHYDPASTFEDNTRAAADNKQTEMVHYYYPGDYAELNNHTGYLWAAFDAIDWPQYLASPAETRGGEVRIDRMEVEVLPRPGDGVNDVVNHLTLGPATISGAGTWTPLASYPLDDTQVNAGSYVHNLTATDGIEAKGASAPVFSEQNLFGMVSNTDLGVKIVDTAGDIVRMRLTIKADASIASNNKVDVRLRLYPEYGEPSSVLYVPGLYTNGIFTSPSVCVPTTAGNDYEVYMKTPALVNDTPFWPDGSDWCVGIDLFNKAGFDPLYPTSLASWFYYTDLRIDSLIKN